MANAYSLELRERVVAAYERGDGSFGTVGAVFGVGETTVKRWVYQYRRKGHVQPRKKAGGTPSDISLDELDRIVERLGDANAGEIAAAYNRDRRGKNRRHVSSIKRALYRAGYVVKKSGFARRNNYDPMSWSSATLTGKR